MINIAIFASGSGTNAENIIKYFKSNNQININLILSNKKEAFVLKRAEKYNIPYFVFTKEEFYKSEKILKKLKEYNIDFVVLAGFLLLIPANIINNYKNKIVNIHPALLPKYGGKGMYGNNVHKAVKLNNETETGITIHYVNEKYDEGAIIFQAKCNIDVDDSIEKIADKVHKLEYKYFPVIIEKILQK